MYYSVEFDIDTFEFWGGAKEVINEMRQCGRIEEVENLVIDTFSECDYPVTATDINDYVWYDVRNELC
jgi:hypothetical protein